MPQQPSSPSLRSSSAANFSSWSRARIDGTHFGFHELADGVSNQALVVGEGKVHRVAVEAMLAQGEGNPKQDGFRPVWFMICVWPDI